MSQLKFFNRFRTYYIIKAEVNMKAVNFDNASLGIELGSTRIKAVLIDEKFRVIADGIYNWENRYENGLWTYSEQDILTGIRGCYADLKRKVREKCGTVLRKVGCIGISAMMHGYIALDKDRKFLVPFRTWRNNNAAYAAEKLTDLFSFPIPARWSIAHLYQAILDGEEHLPSLAYQTTLAGYVHYILTGNKVVGTGEASGMFPVDIKGGDYNSKMTELFDGIAAVKNMPWRLRDILPKILRAGEVAGCLTEEGAKLLDEEGDLCPGIPFCPPEGDAGTGMVATNSVAEGTGNVSAGTSVFGMVVLDAFPKKVYSEIDLVTTPAGKPVAMVHCNNCSSEINAWVKLFAEYNALTGRRMSADELYSALFRLSLDGDEDCGGVISYNYVSGENITEVSSGRPMLARSALSRFTLQNVMRCQLYSSMATLKIGMDILLKKEKISVSKIYAHGGLFRTEGVCQKYLAAALNVPVSVTETAGEGGPWGMALLAAFTLRGGKDLAAFLDKEVFADSREKTVLPDPKTVEGFEKYTEKFEKGLSVEREAANVWEE